MHTLRPSRLLRKSSTERGTRMQRAGWPRGRWTCVVLEDIHESSRWLHRLDTHLGHYALIDARILNTTNAYNELNKSIEWPEAVDDEGYRGHDHTIKAFRTMLPAEACRPLCGPAVVIRVYLLLTLSDDEKM